MAGEDELVVGAERADDVVVVRADDRALALVAEAAGRRWEGPGRTPRELTQRLGRGLQHSESTRSDRVGIRDCSVD